jgi:DNA-binding transcriptional ArsR family regulator
VRTSKTIQASALIFGALGDPTRLRLVERMAHREPLSITSLVDGTDITRQAVTKHLRILERAGLARAERSGREQMWSLDQKRLLQAQAFLDAISRQWDEALERLKEFVE